MIALLFPAVEMRDQLAIEKAADLVAKQVVLIGEGSASGEVEHQDSLKRGAGLGSV